MPMTETSSPQIQPPPQDQTPSRRLVSLDALRGFDMFWIVGGEELVHGLYKGWPNGFTEVLNTQVEHAAWKGFRFYDLIFPMFVFMVGASMVFSLTRIVSQSGKATAFRRILFRTVLMYFFGLLIYGGI